MDKSNAVEFEPANISICTIEKHSSETPTASDRRIDPHERR